MREPRRVAGDYTVRWQGQRWAIPRAQVRAGLRGARVEVETAARRQPLGPLPRLLSQPAALPEPAARARNPLRPTAYGACGPKERQNESTFPLPITLGGGHFYLEKNRDISTLR